MFDEMSHPVGDTPMYIIMHQLDVELGTPVAYRH